MNETNLERFVRTCIAEMSDDSRLRTQTGLYRAICRKYGTQYSLRAGVKYVKLIKTALKNKGLLHEEMGQFYLTPCVKPTTSEEIRNLADIIYLHIKAALISRRIQKERKEIDPKKLFEIIQKMRYNHELISQITEANRLVGSSALTRTLAEIRANALMSIDELQRFLNEIS